MNSKTEKLIIVTALVLIERSGKQHWIRWRYFCPKFFRQSFREYAAESIHHSFWARALLRHQKLLDLVDRS